VQHRVVLEAQVQEIFLSLTMQQAIALLELAQIAYGQMRSVQEFLAHPQLEARQRWRSVDSPVGPLWALLPPALPDGTEPVFNPIPEIGQQSEAILREIGLDDEQIACLVEQ
jgi:itaconate CoA-transferase